MRGSYQHSAIMSKQFTTAGADINLQTTRPGYGTNPNTQDPTLRSARALLITSVAGASNLVVEYDNGTQDTIEISAVAGMPFYVWGQIKLIDSTSTVNIKGNALY